MKRYLLVGLLAAACNSLPLTFAGGPAPAMQDETCEADATLPKGAQIVCCGFSPHLELIGVDGDAVYAATGGGQLFRIEKRSGLRTLLYQAPPDQPGQVASLAADGLGHFLHLAGGRLFFLSSDGVDSVDTAAPSSPRQVLAAAEFEPQPLINEDGIFWLRVQKQPGSVQYLDVRRSPLSGGAGEVLYPTYAFPMAVGSGHLYLTTILDSGSYFPPFPQLLQVPLSGGNATVAVPQIDPAGRLTTSGDGTIAAGEGGVYLLNNVDAEMGYPIYRYPGDGGAGVMIARLPPQNPEVPLGTPFALRVDGSDVYFLRGTPPGVAWDAAATLMRVRQNDAVAVWSANSLGVPVFDDSSIYVAYQRGGVTGPIEGVVARLPK